MSQLHKLPSFMIKSERYWKNTFGVITQFEHYKNLFEQLLYKKYDKNYSTIHQDIINAYIKNPSMFILRSDIHIDQRAEDKRPHYTITIIRYTHTTDRYTVLGNLHIYTDDLYRPIQLTFTYAKHSNQTQYLEPIELSYLNYWV